MHGGIDLEQIFKSGFQRVALKLDENTSKTLQVYIQEKNWKDLDQYFLANPPFLNELPYNNFEHIFSIRDAQDPDQEDGIWHDDGSRELAISLSLSLEEKTIEGGILSLRSKSGENLNQFKTPPFLKGILFATGVHGYEHQIQKVTKGVRIILAGWYTS